GARVLRLVAARQLRVGRGVLEALRDRLRRLSDARADPEGELLLVPRLHRLAAGGGRVARVGLMLYTVRRDCARDFEGTLRAVASLGYEGVELFDLHGHDVRVVRRWLDELELMPCGRHAGLDAVESQLPELAAECAVLGVDRLVLSWIQPPASRDEAAQMAGRLTEVAREAAELGLRFGFHNHDGEVR